MLTPIEDERSWELPVRHQRQDSLVRWGCLVLAVAIVVVLALVATSHGSEFPDAPHAAKHDRIVDWSFVLGHGIYASATAFDNYQTAKNLGSCAFEGNPDLGRNPSNRDIVVHAAVEFGAVVTGDLLIRWWGTRHGIPRWLNMAGGNLGSSIGTIKHARGGLQWVRLCH